jgi:hypothetical protein
MPIIIQNYMSDPHYMISLNPSEATSAVSMPKVLELSKSLNHLLI